MQQLHVITANAFNIWASLTGIHEQPDTLMFGPFTYAVWGYIAFVPVYIYSLFRVWVSKSEAAAYAWVAAIGFASFLLLTNMHERYLYPLFPYFTIAAILNLSLLPIYWVVSGLSLLNMYNFWFTPRLEPVVKFLEFGDRLMPRVLGGINTVLFALVIRKIRRDA